MKMTPWAQYVLAWRREARDMPRAGWEFVGESGGKLWELYRGGRRGWRISEARPACNGLGVWVRVTDAREWKT